jgi:hypothetical protein
VNRACMGARGENVAAKSIGFPIKDSTASDPEFHSRLGFRGA